jgi:hypothetical protein
MGIAMQSISVLIFIEIPMGYIGEIFHLAARLRPVMLAAVGDGLLASCGMGGLIFSVNYF